MALIAACIRWNHLNSVVSKCLLRNFSISQFNRMDDKVKDQFQSHGHLPYGKEGQGVYSNLNLMAFNYIKHGQSLVLKSLDSIPTECGKAINICDYGAADGGTSMDLLGAVVEKIKAKHGQEKEIMVYYEDQASNDFKSLMNRIHGLIPGPPPYAITTQGVYTACTGTNFFSKCFPANTIHLGISFTAMHWLSKRPCAVSDTIYCHLSKNESERKLWETQAAEDWQTILLARAHDLAPGGQMIISHLAVDGEGQYSGNSKNFKNNLVKRLSFHWSQMVKEGKITQEEFINTNYSCYHRSEDELAAPLNDPKSRVFKAGLRLVSIEIHLIPCMFAPRLRDAAARGDQEALRNHAKSLVNSFKPWSCSVFQSALDESRCEVEKSQIVDDLFDRYEAEVIFAQDDQGYDAIQAYIHIKKDV